MTRKWHLKGKKYLEIASNATDISSSRGILNILKDVVAFTMNAAVEEETSGISEGKYKVDIDAGTIVESLRTDHFRESIGCG